MNTSFYNGVVGMKTYQSALDVWGDNIANANTTAFKQNEVDFHSLFSKSMSSGLTPISSDIGLGSGVSSTTMDTKDGSIQNTDNVFDMAIEGQGWFAVQNANQTTYYTRDGSFTRDKDGTLVNQNGQKVLGVSANNLTLDGDKWVFNSSIDTSNLITQTPKLSQIIAPSSIEFPAQATKNISISGNLNGGDIAQNTKPAILKSDFGTLYDKNAQNMNIKTGNDLVFGFGDLPTTYENGLIKSDICIQDDIKDGKDVNIDFDVNGKNIKTTLPDGSSKKQIIDAIGDKLDENGILYDKLDDGIEIKAQNKLIITNNGGDYVTNNATQKLTYTASNPNTENGEFTTINDFVGELQNLANDTYPNDTKVGINNKGSLYIQNNSANAITSFSIKTPTSNDSFMQNLGRLGNIVLPNTASSSLEFTQDYQGFSGDIVDAQGNKNDLKFDWTKTKTNDNQTTWQGIISVVNQNGDILSSTSENFVFDKDGALLSPSSVTIDNNGTPATIKFGADFSGLTSYSKKNTGFDYSQDGILDGYLTGYNVGDNGQIIANFSNGKDGIIAQLPLFHFQNEQGLDSVGANNYTTTSNSGKAFVYTNTDGNYISGGTIKNHALETSNVNMSQAMTELIVLQKAFDANSKSVTTSDEMVQKAINMKK